MGTTADKLQKILDSKAAIKAAIEAKGVSNVGDILAEYPDKIASIQSGGGTCTGFTGHADAEGLKAIGWTDEDIEYYQTHGVNWNEEDDAYHKVPQDNIDLYGVLTIDNIQEYKDRIVYLPKLDTSGVINMSDKFTDCHSMVAVPMLDTSKVTNMSSMFYYCSALVSIPLFDTSKVTNMSSMFNRCFSLISVPLFNTSNVINMNSMFSGCPALISVPLFDTSNVVDMNGLFNSCTALISIPLFNTNKVTSISSIFSSCYSLVLIPLFNVSNITNTNYIFDYCYSIQYANLKGLKASLEIKRISLLQKESLLYIIENAAPTEPITIKLSSYCYNKYNADPDVVAALAKQPNVSLASA